MISHTQVLPRVIEGQCKDPILLRGKGRGGVTQTLNQLEGPLILSLPCQGILLTFGLGALTGIPIFIVLVKCLFFDGPKYPYLIFISDNGYAR